MKELQLNPVTLSVAVNGTIFPFRADSDFAERAQRLGDEAKRRALLAAAEGRHDPAGTKAFLMRAIDTLLDCEAMATLFEGDSPELLDLLDILDLIMSEFHRYRAERIGRLKEGLA